MSRLDSFIRRMLAQRDILNGLPARLAHLPGPVYEFGLGSGRTYDHLRTLFPGRRIVVFESEPCRGTPQPPACDIVAGDLRDTTAQLPDASAALVHADIETGDPAVDARLAAWLPGTIARLLKPGGFAVCGSPLHDERLARCDAGPGIDPDRYHLAVRT